MQASMSRCTSWEILILDSSPGRLKAVGCFDLQLFLHHMRAPGMVEHPGT